METVVKALYNASFAIWNTLIGIAMTIFRTSPTAVSSGTPYGIVHSLYTSKTFDIGKLNAYQVVVKDSPVIELSPEEQNMPYIYRNGVMYLNLDARKNGVPLVSLMHTSLRKIDFENE